MILGKIQISHIFTSLLKGEENIIKITFKIFIAFRKPPTPLISLIQLFECKVIPQLLI